MFAKSPATRATLLKSDLELQVRAKLCFPYLEQKSIYKAGANILNLLAGFILHSWSFCH